MVLGEPRTEAGKQLLRSDFDTTGYGPSMVREHVTRAILAIEAEATETEHDRIVKVLVERWQDLTWCNKPDDCDVRAASIAVVLADLGVPLPGIDS